MSLRTCPQSKNPLAAAMWEIEQCLQRTVWGTGPHAGDFEGAAKAALQKAEKALDDFKTFQAMQTKSEKVKSRRSLQNERDAYLYEAYHKGIKLDAMIKHVNKRKRWPQLKSRAAALKAAERYASRMEKPWAARRNSMRKSGYGRFD